ncbi:flagellar biosynthesis protein FliQ [Nitrospinota bacterium]
MSPEAVMTMMQSAMEMLLRISGPILGAGLLVGILVGIFQAVTQIQEMTLTFVPKILVTIVVLMFAFPWMLQSMIDFTVNLFTSLPDLAR